MIFAQDENPCHGQYIISSKEARVWVEDTLVTGTARLHGKKEQASVRKISSHLNIKKEAHEALEEADNDLGQFSHHSRSLFTGFTQSDQKFGC